MVKFLTAKFFFFYMKFLAFLTYPNPGELNSAPLHLPDEHNLINKLLVGYESASRPVFNSSKPVVVKFGMSFIQICDMDEKNQIITTNIWIELEWYDERLVWNKSAYNNLDKIRLPCNRIWLPDLVLYNSADDYTQGYMQAKAVVEPDGRVFWAPPTKLRSICRFDVTFFPFDDQICYLKFGSWTYTGWSLDLVNTSSEADLSNYMKSGEWDLKRVRVQRNVRYYPCCPNEPFPDVTLYIYMRRRVLYYLVNIIVPCILLSIISVMTFWLPPDSGEKVTLSITVLLAYSVFMLLIAENIPATSEMVPLIGIYLTITMTLTSMSIVLTILILKLHHATPYAPKISRPVYYWITRKLAACLGMSHAISRFERSQVEFSSRSKLNTISSEELAEFKDFSDRLLDPETLRLTRPEAVKEGAENLLDVFSMPLTDDANSSEASAAPSKFKPPKAKKKVSMDNFKNKFSDRDKERAPASLKMIRNSINKNLLEIQKAKTRLAEHEDLRNNKKEEWKLMALILDRVLFYIFSTLSLVSSVVLLFIIPILKNLNVIRPNIYHLIEDSESLEN